MLYIPTKTTIEVPKSLIHTPQASAKKKKPAEMNACSLVTRVRRIASPRLTFTERVWRDMGSGYLERVAVARGGQMG